MTAGQVGAMRVAVLGAAGTIGPAIARDLAESPEIDGPLLLDREAAGEIAAADAADRDALAAALDGRGLVVNAASETTVTMTALTRPHARWGLGGGIVSTAAVAAATARLYARGTLGAATGVLAPEAVLPAGALFAELEERGCTFALS
jgi:saccharopine dehydrogenase-like NADP-dependent oxidoreductase